ncbi:MAG: hypothetical protein OQK82_06585 [Candidatus Pacearchaeota archaeon]|nr:hypothetical protein [Candidatus Pacearchaeota archaeon]
MIKPYKFFEGANDYLAINLDLEIGKKLRTLELYQDLKQALQEEGKQTSCFNRFNFIGSSLLLESISIEGISGDSLYMTPKQREYFSNGNWKNPQSYFPSLLGMGKSITYIPKDHIGQIENLKKIWEIYFNQVNQILK